jgi:hypothetical protein
VTILSSCKRWVILLLLNGSGVAMAQLELPSGVAHEDMNIKNSIRLTINELTECVLKDKRIALPHSDELVRENICGIYLSYDSIGLRQFKDCLAHAKIIAFYLNNRFGSEVRHGVRMRCDGFGPDLYVDLIENGDGMSVKKTSEILP